MKKRITKIYSEFDKAKLYSLEDGVDIAMKSSTAKFNETIDIAINVNVDPKRVSKMLEVKFNYQKV